MQKYDRGGLIFWANFYSYAKYIYVINVLRQLNSTIKPNLVCSASWHDGNARAS